MSGTTIAYTRRSTDRQDTSHDAQLQAIVRAEGEGVVEVRDTCSGSVPLDDRPGGAYALTLLEGGHADRLVVAKLDRLCRSVLDGARVLVVAEEQGWALASLDLGLDTATPMGRAMAHVALAFAELERERIRERTREGLRVARERGAEPGGPRVPDAVARRIARERGEGRSLRAIARALDADGVPTARGAQRWQVSTVQRVLSAAEPAP